MIDPCFVVHRVLNAHDYFLVLLLPRDATSNEVKRSFLKLSKHVHPDKNHAKGANEAFDRLNAARTTLADDAERAAYAHSHPPQAQGAREWAHSVERHASRAP